MQSFSRIGISIFALCLTLFGSHSLTRAQISFSPSSDLPVSQEPDDVAAGDFDGDGDLDLAVSADTLDRLEIFVNTGPGTFDTSFSVLTGPNTGPAGVVAGDFDLDGDIDLATSLHNVNTVQIVLNDGLGNFSLGLSFGAGIDTRSIEAFDMDGDGDLDLVATNRDSNNVTVLQNMGAGNFSPVNVTVGLEPRDVSSGDWDGDGDIDLAVTNHDSRTVSILTNNGGAFANTTTLSVGANVRPEGIVAADVDGDLDRDLLVAVSGNGLNLVAVFTNNAGTFVGPINSPVLGLDPGGIAAADFDLDGMVDVVTSNQDSGNLSVLPGLGNGSFGAANLLPVGTSPERVTVADIDGNGSGDILVANGDSNSVSVYLNDTQGGPTAAQFTRGDCNGDGAVAIADAVFSLNFLFVPGSATPSCEDACDLGDDGIHNLGDVVFLLSFLFSGGPAAAPPIGTCGPDPTADSLSCLSSPVCP